MKTISNLPRCWQEESDRELLLASSFKWVLAISSEYLLYVYNPKTFMSLLTPQQYREAEGMFINAFSICRPFLSSQATKNIEHYLQHSELEIAYESLGLSLKSEGVKIPPSVKKILYPLGSILHLDKESVLSANFWKDVSPLLKP